MSQQQNLPIPEEVKAYYQIKSSTVQEMKDLLWSIKWTKEQDLQARVRELEEELRHLRNSKKYGLVWDSEREPEQVVVDCQKKLPILKEIKERKILGDDTWDSDLLIEGDNYHALQVLSYTHRESIDLIYIDPPYNTWNNDFIYNDKIVDTEDTYKHSKWLNFMEKRLRLAYDLLKEDGLIFISIDDNEQAQLKLLCDEIFGENNFVSNIIWNSRKSVSNDAIVSLNHNHTLVYTNDIYLLQKRKNDFRLKIDTLKFANPDNDINGPWCADPFDAPNIRPNLTYEIINPNTGKIFLPPKWRCWRTTKDDYLQYLNEWRIIFWKNWQSKPQLKRYLKDVEEWWRVTKSIWDDIWTTTNWTKELEKILWEKKFTNPKPISLLNRILELSTYNNSIILDFFAGSWTTWHSVLEMNKEDRGNRKFILCTNNENNICEEVTYERIKRVSQWYTNTKGKMIEGLGGNLRYYKTAFVEVENLHEITDDKKLELTYNAWELLAIKEEIYNERIKTEYGQVFENSKDIVAVYFKESTRDLTQMAEELATIQREKWWKVIWYIYGNAFQEDSFPMIENLELKDIPDPILKVYREINKV